MANHDFTKEALQELCEIFSDLEGATLLMTAL